MMTKKHYVAIAAAVKKLRQGDYTVDAMIQDFVIIFKNDNPAFSAATFRAACEPGPEDMPR